MSVYDPHRIFSPNSSRHRHKGQIIQSRLVDRPVTIDQRLVPIYRDFLLTNGLIPLSSDTSLPVRLSVMNFVVPGLEQVDFTFDDIVNSWPHLLMTDDGDFWHLFTQQPVYSFMLCFVPLETHLAFFISGSHADPTQTSSYTEFRLYKEVSETAPIVYYRIIIQTPPDTSPFYGFWNFLVDGDVYMTFSGRQFFIKSGEDFPKRWYPSPQFLPRTLFDI